MHKGKTIVDLAKGVRAPFARSWTNRCARSGAPSVTVAPVSATAGRSLGDRQLLGLVGRAPAPLS
jgi:hypothetical protein